MVINKEKAHLYPKPYNQPEMLELSHEEMTRRVVKAAGKTLVLISGGAMMGDDDLLEKSDVSLRAGVCGFIFGRNMWQRPFDEAMAITKRIKDLLINAR